MKSIRQVCFVGVPICLTLVDLAAVVASSEPPSGKYKSEGQKARLNKRKLVSDSLFQHREELFAGEFEG